MVFVFQYPLVLVSLIIFVRYNSLFSPIVNLFVSRLFMCFIEDRSNFSPEIPIKFLIIGRHFFSTYETVVYASGLNDLISAILYSNDRYLKTILSSAVFYPAEKFQ